MKDVYVQTPYTDELSDIKTQIEKLNNDYDALCEAEEQYIIDNKVYYSMDDFPEMFKEALDEEDHGFPECEVTLVIRVRPESQKEFGPVHLLVADDAGDCEWPSLDSDGKFYWNTLNRGILEWDKKEQSYVWWCYHRKSYVEILGFVSIKNCRDLWERR